MAHQQFLVTMERMIVYDEDITCSRVTNKVVLLHEVALELCPRASTRLDFASLGSQVQEYYRQVS